MFNKQCFAVLFFVSIITITGCKKNDQPTLASSDANEEEIICPMLYQKNDSLLNALKFIEAPEEKYKSYNSSIQKTGELVSGELLKVANKYLSLGTNKNPELFISMLSAKTKDILNDDSKNGDILHHINQIKEGTLFNSKEEYQYLAVSSIVPKKLLETLKKANFTQTPTHRIIFYHFYRPQYTLIGSSVYFIEEDGSYKIVSFETISKEKLADITQPLQKPNTQEYGIISYKENTEDETKSLQYTFEVMIKPEETIENTFEILKLIEVISEFKNIDIHPDIAKQILIDREVFDKYKDKQLYFKFYIGKPDYNLFNYGQHLSGFSFAISIANLNKSSTMFYIGKDILNLQTNQNGYFIDSDLELMSFESEENGVRYKNRVLLRKTQIEKATD